MMEAIPTPSEHRFVAVIEDDPVQAELISCAFSEAGFRIPIETISDGEEAMRQLYAWFDGDCQRRPSLVLLDIRLPRLSGLEVLGQLRERFGEPPFPIIILTSSKLPNDLVDAFSGGAVSYFVKPLGFNALVELVDRVGRRWLDAPNLK